MTTCETCRCPKCGSTEVAMPRAYGPGMRLAYCCRTCLSCGHEGRRWPSVVDAHDDPEWTEARAMGLIENLRGQFGHLRPGVSQYPMEAVDALERLKGYAVHGANCSGYDDCTCGLSALLREIDGE